MMLNTIKEHKSFITYKFGSQSPRVCPYPPRQHFEHRRVRARRARRGARGEESRWRRRNGSRINKTAQAVTYNVLVAGFGAADKARASVAVMAGPVSILTACEQLQLSNRGTDRTTTSMQTCAAQPAMRE